MRRGSRIFKASAPGSLRSCPKQSGPASLNRRDHYQFKDAYYHHYHHPGSSSSSSWSLGWSIISSRCPNFSPSQLWTGPQLRAVHWVRNQPQQYFMSHFHPPPATAQVWNDQLGETLALSHSHSSCHTFDLRQIHSAVWDKYVLHIETNTFCNLRNPGLVPQPLELPHSFAWRLSTWEYLINPHKYGEVTQLKYLINQHTVAKYQSVF